MSVRYFSFVTGAVLTMLAIVQPSCADGPTFSSLLPAQAVLPGLSVVSPQLIRGAQPTKGGLEKLKNAGVKTVINLRHDVGAGEKDDAQKLGLNYFDLPIYHSKGIPQEHVRKFLEIVSDPQLQPVFIHCKEGMDRTGALVGIYRIEKEGWMPLQSYQEMVSQGFHPLFRNLTKSVFSFGEQKGRKQPLPSLSDALINITRLHL